MKRPTISTPSAVDPGRTGQGRPASQCDAFAASSGPAADVVAREQAARRDVPAWLAVPGMQLCDAHRGGHRLSGLAALGQAV